MAIHSFTEYVKATYYNAFCSAAEGYFEATWNPNEWTFQRLHRPGRPEIESVEVMYVWAHDQDGMPCRDSLPL